MITFILLVIGGLNWLLFGVLGWDVGQKIFGGMDALISRLIYILVGLSAIVELVTHKKNCKMCGMGKSGMSGAPSGGSPSSSQPGMGM